MQWVWDVLVKGGRGGKNIFAIINLHLDYFYVHFVNLISQYSFWLLLFWKSKHIFRTRRCDRKRHKCVHMLCKHLILVIK